MSTQPAGSFCLCSFRQAVGRLWSLHVSGIPRHMDYTLVEMLSREAGSFCLCCF